jgi:hypothetical protein
MPFYGRNANLATLETLAVAISTSRVEPVDPEINIRPKNSVGIRLGGFTGTELRFRSPLSFCSWPA